ncbi:tripartite tricarboxylate transporter substrate binding protein [Variovorax sp. J22P240]|uniref:Bug family tripartite tricarboxylate transporter substrate binding protein n=1 Tax=Variovorax sp. J22P240 TaxID=3053514 RepID=UPI0025786F74|nr:tripartite tricarboxylate transporter substrate binding protein [Variovorax sp. J22P240]MDM0000650.1 tripartite tricarboxylate transporter substrate binding protein [Variovorax sp. J22P240]
MNTAYLASLAAIASSICASPAQADTYPSKPITIVVPSAAAGSTDIMARMIGDQLGKALGQSVIVDNKPGASGNIGTEAVARAAPDGYTLLMQYSGYHVGNPALFPQIRWKTSDFAPIALVMRAPHVIAVSGTLPATNLKELISSGQKNGKGLFFASSGNGSIQHIAGEMFARQAKVQAAHVPYKGAGPVVTDLISGQVDMFITTPPSVIGQVQAGKIKAMAYAGPKRHPSMPTVPTTAEAGLPGYEVESWFALFAPAKTPPEIVARLTAQVKTIVESETFRKKVEDQGAFAAYMDPPALGKFVDQETALWAKVIKDGNIKPD